MEWPCMWCNTPLNDETECLMGELILCEPCSEKLCDEMNAAIEAADKRIAESESDHTVIDWI